MTIDSITLDDIKKLKLKSSDTLEFNCVKCSTPFSIRTARVKSILKGRIKKTQYYCWKCSYSARRAEWSINEISCVCCGRLFFRNYRSQKFCNSSCTATYHNKRRKTGTRRSKLESYIEEQLKLLYPNLEILYNQKNAINSELDIYIPSINLAFELNGIFHYEAIFSPEQLMRCQNNDNRKVQACVERGIELCIIDTSSQSHVTPHTSQKYLDIIINLLRSKDVIPLK